MHERPRRIFFDNGVAPIMLTENNLTIESVMPASGFGNSANERRLRRKLQADLQSHEYITASDSEEVINICTGDDSVPHSLCIGAGTENAWVSNQSVYPIFIQCLYNVMCVADQIRPW